MDAGELKAKTVAELQEIAKGFGIEGFEEMKKAELVKAILVKQSTELDPGDSPATASSRGASEPAPTPEKIRVKLAYPIKFGGKWFAPGKKVTLPADIANDLIAAKTAVPV